MDHCGERRRSCVHIIGWLHFLPTDARQLYAFSKEGNAISYWIHFTGTAIEDALADLPYKRTFCGQVDERMQFESLLHQLSQTHHMRGPAYLLDEGGLLLQILASLSRSVNRQESTECSEIRAAAAYLCEHFCQPLSLADCAAHLHLSVSRFSHLFTKTIGVSPYQYLLRLRLDRACALLLHTELDIRHIAQLVGFDDPSYFSRLFRKRFAKTPGAFRTAYSQELSEHPASALPVL